jgi:hypothetical protein
MKDEPKKKPEPKVDDIYKASSTQCSLIPIEDWMYKPFGRQSYNPRSTSAKSSFYVKS